MKRQPEPITQGIIAALALPIARSPQPLRPLPLPNLHELPRSSSLLYAINRVDESGKVTSRPIITALGWKAGDKVELMLVPGAIVLRSSADGLSPVLHRAGIIIPAPARRHHGIGAGDPVLLAAAPDYGTLIVYPVSVLDEMLASYHLAHAAGEQEPQAKAAGPPTRPQAGAIRCETGGIPNE